MVVGYLCGVVIIFYKRLGRNDVEGLGVTGIHNGSAVMEDLMTEEYGKYCDMCVANGLTHSHIMPRMHWQYCWDSLEMPPLWNP